MKSYSLNFEGSWIDVNRHFMPNYAGVYLVYRGTHNAEKQTVNCAEIIYIGKALDIRQRLSNHDKRNAFVNELQNGEVLFYSCAKVPIEDLDRVENALIYKMQPKLNDILKDSFLYPITRVISEGACALLTKDFTLDNGIR